MFSYYGSKSKVIGMYPRPKFGKIIEPFAGSARYSLKYFDRDVLLVDKYELIIKIWKWLQVCTLADILKLPEPERGTDIRIYKFDCDEARDLMRFMIGGGLSHPQWIVSRFGGGVKSQKKSIAGNLYKIKHWKIEIGSYEDIPNQEATWFIDPPYQVGGHKYREHKIDFVTLGKWCKTREGQAIVCENTKADWMEFCPMRKNHGAYSTTTEAIWSNLPHGFEMKNMEMFK